MLRLRHMVAVCISSLCFFLGYFFADASYDFINYVNYVSHSELTGKRFASEPAFVWLTAFLNEFIHDDIYATRFLYGLSFLSLSFGVLTFGYAIRAGLRIRSLLVVPICFTVALPLLSLMAIVPRQCLASGFSFFAMAIYAKSACSGRPIPKAIGLKIVFLFTIAMLFHNLSTMLALCLFSWLFLQWTTLLILGFVGLIALPFAIFFMVGAAGDLIPAAGSAMTYFGDSTRDTGAYRLGVFLFVSLLFVLTTEQRFRRAGVFGGNPRLRVIILAATGAIIYYLVSPDVVRALYYPTVAMWLFAGVSFVKRKKYDGYVSRRIYERSLI